MRPGVPCFAEKYSNMRSRPRHDCAYSPTGVGAVASLAPAPPTGTRP